MDLEPPFDRLDASRIRKALYEALYDFYAVDDRRGLVRFSNSPVYVGDLLCRGLPGSSRRRAMRLIEEHEFEVSEALPVLFGLADGCPPEEVWSKDVVYCWVVSGFGDAWSLTIYTTREHGYVIYRGTGDESPEHRLTLLGMWHPVWSEEARRECVTTCYARHWRDCCLPPQLGECARGEQPLWMECLLRLLHENPELWPAIVNRMPYPKVFPLGCVEFVERVAGLGRDRVLELYKECGLDVSRLEQRLAARHEMADREPLDDDEGDDESDDESVSYKLIEGAAPFDPESARFMVANFCYMLEHTTGAGRETDAI